jgi:hypothetical protein
LAASSLRSFSTLRRGQPKEMAAADDAGGCSLLDRLLLEHPIVFDRPGYGGFLPQQDHTLLTENSVLRGRIDGLEAAVGPTRSLSSLAASGLPASPDPEAVTAAAGNGHGAVWPQ